MLTRFSLSVSLLNFPIPPFHSFSVPLSLRVYIYRALSLILLPSLPPSFSIIRSLHSLPVTRGVKKAGS